MNNPGRLKRLIDIIRKQVPRPSHSPVFANGSHGLRFHSEVIHNKGLFCPLGLLPNALYPAPLTAKECGLHNTYSPEIRKFIDWWDKLTIKDSEKAMDYIWGTKKCKTK